MKLDILAFSAHPDDVELSCSGTMIKHAKMGKKTGIVDLTQGELGTRGTAETRKEEAAEAAKILGLSARENLRMKDGFFEISEENKLKVIWAIRKYQPEVVLANSITDRHPDHARAAKLVAEACFLAGLPKIITLENGEHQKAWRPKNLLHYIQDHYIHPDIVFDIGEYIDEKLASIKAYRTQFFNPNSEEPQTPISGSDFIEFLEGRARNFGRIIGVEFGEGFTVSKAIKGDDITSL